MVRTMEPTSVNAVIEFAQDIPLAWLECRGEEHDWRKLNAYLVTDREDPLYGTRYRSRRCFNCKGIKERWTDPATGRVVKTGRRMPEGYDRRGQGRIDQDGKDVLRAVLIQREMTADATLPKKPRSRKAA